MYKKSQRGFTLVELLVVIAVMISILSICVVSLIGISSKRKESASNEIKEQIVVAAEQYFSSNEYLLNQVNDSKYAFVSVGTLVNNDYINKITDPKTGKKVDNCALVVVENNNNRFKYAYTEPGDDTYQELKDNLSIGNENGSGNCEMDLKGLEIKNDEQTSTKTTTKSTTKSTNKTTVKSTTKSTTTTIKCPTWSYTSSKTYKNGWYYGTVIVKASDQTECKLEKSGYCTSIKNSKCKSKYINIDDKKPTIEIKVYKNSSDNILTSKDGLKEYDKSGAWYNKNAYVEIDKDAGVSGIKSFKCTDVRSDGQSRSNIRTYRNIKTSGTTTINCSLTTKSGKKASASYVIKLDHENPKCSVTLSGKEGNENNKLKWYVGDVTYNATCTDKGSGCSNSLKKETFNTEGKYSNKYIVVTDKSGNSTKCAKKTFAIDKTAPVISYADEYTGTYSGGNDACGTSSGARTNYTIIDEISGIASVHDYYTPNNDNTHLTDIGRFRVENKKVTYNGVKDNYFNIEYKAVNNALSKISYKDIWTKTGSCASGSGIKSGTYYHKEKACDIAGNCTLSKTKQIIVN